MAFGVPVSIGIGRDFWREEVISFEIYYYKCGFRDGFMFICENFIIRDFAFVIPVRLVPRSCSHLFRKRYV